MNESFCPDCGEPLTVEGSLTPEEFAVNGADPQHVFCDICGKAEHPADMTTDWNGETGNHLSCEGDELARLEAAFEAAGGRGVDLAEQIDALRADIAKADYLAARASESLSYGDLLYAQEQGWCSSSPDGMGSHIPDDTTDPVTCAECGAEVV